MGHKSNPSLAWMKADFSEINGNNGDDDDEFGNGPMESHIA